MAKSCGWIEVICGSMFSGKTEELIRRLRRAIIAKQKVEIFKPAMDNRYGEGNVTSHSKQYIPSKVIQKAEDILAQLDPDTHVVGIDEAQFLGENIPKIVDELAERGLRVIVTGLDQDYKGRPFEPMPEIMAMAEYVTKCQAICVVCGSPASRTQRTVADKGRVQIGAAESYEARCRACFDPTLSQRISEKNKNCVRRQLSMHNDQLNRVEVRQSL